MSHIKEKQVFLWLIILQPILDVIAYFQYNNVIGSIAGYSRLIVMLILPVYVLFKTKKKRSFILLMGIIGIYSLLHIANGFRVGYVSLFDDVAYLLRVIQMPVLTICFVYYMKHDESYMDVGAKGYFINSLIIFGIIVVGVMTNTCDTTYAEVGLLGWFGNSNSQSIIMTCLIPFAIYYLLEKRNLPLFIVGIAVTTFLLLSNGTKGAYYSTFLIYGGFFVFFIIEAFIRKQFPDRIRLAFMAILVITSGIAILVYPSTPRYFMDNEYYSARETEVEEMKNDLVVEDEKTGEKLNVHDPKVYAKLVAYYEPMFNKGLVKEFGIDRVLEAYGYTPDPYTISDNRLVKRMYAQFVWEDSDTLTKFVGFEFSRIGDFDLENDFSAIYYYYGYIGFALYAGFIGFFVLCIILRVIKSFTTAMTIKNFTLLITLCLLIGLAQYSGALLRRPNGSIYLSIVLALIFVETVQPIKKLKDK